MIIESILVATCAFGTAAFLFSAGLVVGSVRKGGAQTLPVTHVSFDADISDEERLRFLAEAAQAVTSGQLSQANELGNGATGDKEE